MIWTGSQGLASGVSSAPVDPRRWALRVGAAGVAVVATAGMGTATAAMAATAAVAIAVPCSTTALANAITGAPRNAILSLAPGCTYRLTAGLPTVAKNLTIQGNGDTITRSNSAQFTALIDAGVRLTINRLTMTDFANYSTSARAGAAVKNKGGIVTVTNSRFAGNDGTLGGAILNKSSATTAVATAAVPSGTVTSGTLTITNTSFTDNHADFGGAIANEEGSTATLTADTFYGNEAHSGGAVYIHDGTVNVAGTAATTSANNSFVGNVANGDDSVILGAAGRIRPDFDENGYGGAIFNAGGTLTATYATFTRNGADKYGGGVYSAGTTRSAPGGITSSVSGSGFTGNEARYGGAISASESLNLTNDLISGGNEAYEGGGIAVFGGRTILAKTFVFGNRAEHEGGGIYRESGSVRLTNGSLVTLNRPNNCANLFC